MRLNSGVIIGKKKEVVFELIKDGSLELTLFGIIAEAVKKSTGIVNKRVVPGKFQRGRARQYELREKARMDAKARST
jgi:hypothetical protein